MGFTDPFHYYEDNDDGEDEEENEDVYNQNLPASEVYKEST